MSRGRKLALVIVCIIAGFIVACVVVAPRLLRVDRYRPYVTSLIERRTGRTVAIGRLGLTVFPVVTITVSNFAIANPPGFPPGNWLAVKQIDARPDVGALWHRRIVIRSLSLTQPVLTLLSDARGHWNYELPPQRPAAANDPPGGPDAASGNPSGPSFTLEEISDLSLKGGSIALASVTARGDAVPPEVVAEGVSAGIKNINLAAFARPQSAAAGFIPAAGALSVTKLVAENLLLTNVTSPVEATPQNVRLRNVKFDSYGGHGQADVSLNLVAPVLQYSAQGQLSGVNAEALLNQFPQARGQLSGILEGRFTFSGEAMNSPDPWAGKQGHGTLVVRKGRLPRLHLNQSLLELAHLAELGPASGDLSAFSVISLDWQLGRGLLDTRNVRIEGNGITVDGSGVIDLAGPGRLNYEANAQITARANLLTNVLAGFSGATFANGKLHLPFTLSGTLANPLFRLNTASALGRVLKTPSNNAAPASPLIQNLLDIFKRKK